MLSLPLRSTFYLWVYLFIFFTLFCSNTLDRRTIPQKPPSSVPPSPSHHQTHHPDCLIPQTRYLPTTHVRKLLSNCFAYENLFHSHTNTLKHPFHRFLYPFAWFRFFNCKSYFLNVFSFSFDSNRFMFVIVVGLEMQKSRAIFLCLSISSTRLKSIRSTMCRHLIMYLSFRVYLQLFVKKMKHHNNGWWYS